MDTCTIVVSKKGLTIEVVCDAGFPPLSVEPAVVDKRTTLSGETIIDSYGLNMSYTVEGVIPRSKLQPLLTSIGYEANVEDPFLRYKGVLRRVSTQSEQKDLTFQEVGISIEFDILDFD